MKSVFAATAIALTLSTSAFAATIEGAEAVGGVVHFTGFITDSTCQVNGQGNPFDETLDLGTYLTSDFVAAGDKSTSVPLNLSLTDCPESVTGVSLRVTSTEGADDYASDYKIAEGSAAGVAIRLSDDEGTAIEYGEQSKIYPVSGGAGEVVVEAQYVATVAGADMTAGNANLDATFAINYK
ncbi:type 1 fimbrial protein [Vibrio natriegens]|uniref:fimbrial protein n=1 Tax=Vibrio natriegens TaxID=691 RepID=UPI0021E77AE4|nr:fimbrial protein [Vibrio natriegens]UYI45914.1 type 1 fimbrial protein [Vibrio natriegens]